MIGSYYSQEEVEFYYDRLNFYAEQVARREITLADVPRHFILDSFFFNVVFKSATGSIMSLERYQKLAILKDFIDARKAKDKLNVCHAKVSPSSL